MKDLQNLKSFEDACLILGVSPDKVVPDFSCYPEKHRKSMEAHAKIVLIVEASNKLANDGKAWLPDFDNEEQYKYEVWYEKGSSGFRFAGYVTGVRIRLSALAFALFPGILQSMLLLNLKNY